jgi:AcrR family transcriptional regulator
MGLIERKERQKDSLRRQILDAAREILLKEGAAKLSMRKIADCIEYSPTTIYLYFKNKNEILYCLCEEALERLYKIMDASGSDETTHILRLRASMRAFIDFGFNEPDRYKIIFMSEISRYVSAAVFLEKDKIGGRILGIVRQRLENALSDSGCGLDPEDAFQALWANCHGIVSLLICLPDFPWRERERLIEASLDITLRGLAL